MREGSRIRAARPLAGAVLVGLLVSAGCASHRAAAHYAPASELQGREALDAWASIRRRAEALPPSRLLYDARLSGKGVPALPGTLAVTYDGSDVSRASLTGPFGSSVAEYADGTLKSGGRQPFPVDPRLLKSVLAGAWPGDPRRIGGCDGAACLLVFEGPIRANAVVDSKDARLLSMRITGEAGSLSVTYDGPAPSAWPERISVEEEGRSRSLALRLVASEPVGETASPEGSTP